ncbi:AHH domain-containing protein, partial [Actinocrinis puniceicyclus]
DPTQLGGYDYAGNDPTTGSDPTGLRAAGDGNGSSCDWHGNCSGNASDSGSGGCDSSIPGCPGYQPPADTSLLDTAITSASQQPGLGVIGWVWHVFNQGVASNPSNPGQGVVDQLDGVDTIRNGYDTGNTQEMQQGIAQFGLTFAPGLDGLGALDDSDSLLLRTLKCGGNSFTADTKVLTASGDHVKISALIEGQLVVATDTKSGTKQVEPVAAVMVHHDTNLYDLKIDGKRGLTTTIHTTSNHAFWDETTHAWVEAAKLRNGDRLHTPDGDVATVVSGQPAPVTKGWMWDLTVPADHDFYVVAGRTAVLVHNCTTSSNAQILDDNMQAAGTVRPADTAAHHIVASTSPKAASARAQLASFGIDINDADNGVYLPRGSASSNPLGMAVHSRVHTNLYYDNVNEMMSWAQNADQARDVLGYIRNQLQSGPWP